MVTSKTDIAPWLVDKKDFPGAGTRAEQMRFLLRYAVLAPSFYNSQPWKFSIDERTEEYNVYVDRSSWLKSADPDQRELYISMGCTLENLFVAIDYFNLGHQTVYFPENGNHEWVANIRMVTPRKSLGPRAHELFDAIKERRTIHRIYKNKPLSGNHVERIKQFLTELEYKIYLDITDDQDVKIKIDHLIAEGDAALFSNEVFRRELNKQFEQGKYGRSWLLEQKAKLTAGESNIGEYVADQERNIIGSAPVVAVLSCRYDNRISQVKAGQTFERICLEATLLGIRIHPMFQIMEIPELQTQLRQLFPDMKGYPQLIFAMGYADRETEMSPRKTVEEVLV